MKMRTVTRWLTLPVAMLMMLGFLLMGAGLLYQTWSTDEALHMAILQDPAVMQEQRAAWSKSANQIAMEEGMDPSLLTWTEPILLQADRAGTQWLLQLLKDGKAPEQPNVALQSIRKKLLTDAALQQAHPETEDWVDEKLLPRLQQAALEAAVPLRFGLLQTGLQMAGERVDLPHRVQIPQYLPRIGLWLSLAMLALLALLSARELRWAGFMTGAALSAAAALTGLVYTFGATTADRLIPMAISARYAAIRRAWSDYLVQIGLPLLIVLLLIGIAIMLLCRQKKNA